MPWRKMLAYITGTVDQELLLRNEYLAAENRILRAKIRGRLLLTDPERATLARIGKRLGRKALEGLSGPVGPPSLGRYCAPRILPSFASPFASTSRRNRGGSS